jgi:hypothetical protein
MCEVPCPALAALAARPAGASLPPGAGPLVMELRNEEGGARGRGLSTPVCRLLLPAAGAATGPRMQLALPSFRCGRAQHSTARGLTWGGCSTGQPSRMLAGLLAPSATMLPPSACLQACCAGGQP